VPADPRATVVVVNWNGERWLGPCLTALAAQRTSSPFDVWVVDNASTDGSLALLARDHPRVRSCATTATWASPGATTRPCGR
jgi:GT2 family glycosyltransferase